MPRSSRTRQARRPGPVAAEAEAAVARPQGSARVQAIAIFVVAICLRALHLWVMRDSLVYRALVGDAWQYDRWAASIANGQWIGNEIFYQTPLYPYSVGVLYAVFGHDPWMVRIGQSIAGSIACVLLARASSRFFDQRTGWVAGLMMAFYPPAIFFDGILQKASLDLLLTSLLVWLLSIARSRPQPLVIAALGMALGLFVLNRENAAVLAPVVLAWIVWLCRPQGFAALAVRSAAFLVGMAAVLVPVGLRNQHVGGEFLLTTSQLGPNFYIGNHHGAKGSYEPLRPYRGDVRFERFDAHQLAEEQTGKTLSPGEVSAYWLHRTLGEIRDNPADWLRLVAWKSLLTFHALEIVDAEGVRGHATESFVLRGLSAVFHFGVLCPLAVAGIWFTRSRARELWILYALPLAFAAGVILFYVFARYRYPLVPLLVPFAAAGLVTAYDLVRSLDGRAFRELAVGLALAGAAAVPCNWPLPPAADADLETTWIGVGTALLDADQPEGAIEAFRRALAVRKSPAAYNNLGLAYRAAGNRAEARRYIQLALDSDAKFPGGHLVMGSLCDAMGDSAAAIEHLTTAVKLEPGSSRARAELGRVLMAQGRVGEAIEQLREATSLDAAALDAANNLAWIYATAPDETIRRPDEAIALAEGVCHSIDPADPMYPAYLDTLAASYAAAGRFDTAVETIDRAIGLAGSRGRDALLAELERHRQLYAADKPYLDDTLRSK